MKFVKGYCREGQVFRGNQKLPKKKSSNKSISQSDSNNDSIPKTQELTPSQKVKLDKDINTANTVSYDKAYKDYMKREAEKVKSERKAIKNQSQNSKGSGWHDESQRHAQARMGIKTANNTQSPDTIQQPTDIPSDAPTDITSDTGQVKLANNIQDDMHKLDKLLRHATNLSDKKRATEKLLEAEKYYLRLSDKMKHHKNNVGELPQWVNQTWQGTEDFGIDGTVRKKMDKLLNADKDNFEKRQVELFNAVRLPTEPIR